MNARPSKPEKLRALYRVAVFRPVLFVGILLFSLFAALLEGIGLSFLIPIIDLARGEGGKTNSTEAVEWFTTLYEFLNIPFTLEFVVTGVAIVMVVRYSSSFFVAWWRALLKEDYVRYLRIRAFNEALEAEIPYFDDRGSNEIINTIVTETIYSKRIINNVTNVLEQGLLSLVYLAVALYLAPVLTLVAGLLLGTLTYGFRSRLESAYDVGDRVAGANERVQKAVQAGMQGIRDVKLFGLVDELFADFRTATDEAAELQTQLSRNEAALDNFYQLATALTVFGLIYVALTFSSLSLAGLGVFLFAMFRLAPRVSTLNNQLYKIEGSLPHLVQTQEFVDELAQRKEIGEGSATLPAKIEQVAFQHVSFAYDTGERIFEDFSMTVDRNDFVAIVGPSGAGKSTVASLATRMYEPDSGEITADGTSIDQFDVDEWRSRVSVVRQQPFIFNDTLERNVTVGDRKASRADVERVCEIAQVSEFLDDLPNGYETVLGDDGIRLSGGQKQRVALARALLKDADLLVLDEATSDLDSNIEENVHRAIETMERDYATIVIAHRLSTVVNADYIYVLEDGSIVESGTHEELVTKNGTYADLYDIQTSRA